MSQLVDKLSAGEHPVEISLRPERSVKALKECIDRGFLHVKFTGTQGGTELGFPLSNESSLNADFDNGTGTITVVGDLTLDYRRVRCVAEIELPSMSGTGHLVVQ
jgi:hypothetical protein